MKIIIKANNLRSKKDIELFNRQSKFLSEIRPEDRFVVLANDGHQEHFNSGGINFEYHYFNQPTRGRLNRLFWEKFKLPRIVNRLLPDQILTVGNLN